MCASYLLFAAWLVWQPVWIRLPESFLSEACASMKRSYLRRQSGRPHCWSNPRAPVQPRQVLGQRCNWPRRHHLHHPFCSRQAPELPLSEKIGQSKAAPLCEHPLLCLRDMSVHGQASAILCAHACHGVTARGPLPCPQPPRMALRVHQCECALCLQTSLSWT